MGPSDANLVSVCGVGTLHVLQAELATVQRVVAAVLLRIGGRIPGVENEFSKDELLDTRDRRHLAAGGSVKVFPKATFNTLLCLVLLCFGLTLRKGLTSALALAFPKEVRAFLSGLQRVNSESESESLDGLLGSSSMPVELSSPERYS